MSHCLSVADFQNYPSPISCWRPARGRGKREEGGKKTHAEAAAQTIMSPNESITISLTAIQLFHISVLGGDDVWSLSYPSPLRSACQPASGAEQGRRNSGHNETDDNKAEDGEMAVTE